MSALTSQHYRATQRRYGVMVPCAEVPAHLLNGWRIICDAEDITDVVVMAEPAAPREAPARPSETVPARQQSAAA